MDSLDSKTATVLELEGQINELKASLTEASAGFEAKRAAVEKLEMAKQASEVELQEAKETLAKLKSEGQNNGLILQSVQSEVDQVSLSLSFILFLFS